jgi:sortase A
LELGLRAAPTLSTEELGAQMSDDELTEVMDVIRSSQNQVAGAEDTEIFIPDRIVIPSINLDAPILLGDFKDIPFWGKVYKQWTAPNANAVGWHYDSATLGNPGNTVLNGHHNIYGEVYRYLSEVKPGGIIYLYSGDKGFSYIVGLVEIIPEKYQSVEDRLDNARWTFPSEDERITLISCWPYEGNTHRVVVVAVPIELDGPLP